MDAVEPVSRPPYETPTIIQMDRDEVLQAFQMTAAQIGKPHEMARRCQDTKFKECE